MKYYRAYIVCGGKKKHQQYNRTIFVQTAEKVAPLNEVFRIVHKISFGRWITIQNIDREQYLAGVSKSR
jgi:hypothetical protein